MSDASTTRLALALALFSTGAFSACDADESVLDQTFRCDPEEGDAQCGTDENGQPMSCYLGSAQLGGEAFCTKTCDPAREPPAGFRCTASGALLETCDPSADNPGCPSSLKCYRTDVLAQDGLCMWVDVCPYASDGMTLDDDGCGPSHPTCAGDLLRSLADDSTFAAVLLTDNLPCVRNCRSFECRPAGLPEVCPAEFYAFNFGDPLICASRCDELACPPNFSCAGISDEGESLCLPGVPGMRCMSSEDCLAGECIDIGAGFSVCALRTGCWRNEDCLYLGTSPPFTCVGVPGEKGHCVSTIPFHGENCEHSSECSTERRCGSEVCPPRFCSHYSPAVLNQGHGECRFACDAGVGCPAFGGVPHACLEDGSCYPGTFGVPCSTSSECVTDLACGTVPPDSERSRSEAPSICTLPCNDDTDCSTKINPWLGPGYCVEAPDPPSGRVGYCRPGAQPGRPCDKPEHCVTRNCELHEDGTMSCGSES